MSETDETRRGESQEDEAAEDSVVALLRLAGPRPSVPLDRLERTKAAAREAWQETVRARSRRRLVWGFAVAAAAAAAGIVVAIGLFGGRVPRPSGPPVATVAAVTGVLRPAGTPSGAAPLRAGAALRAGHRIETDPASRAALLLGNGQSLRLDFDTRIRLESASSFFLERGGVYVDSGGSGAARTALEVRTRMGVARDVGTQFEVRLQESSLRLRVREGRVVLDRGGGPEEASGGTELELDSHGVVKRTSLARGGPQWSWVLRIAPPFALEGRPLPELLEWVSRETGLPVRFASEDLSRKSSAIVLHGSIEGVPPDEALAAVLPTCGLDGGIENGGFVIRAADGRRRIR